MPRQTPDLRSDTLSDMVLRNSAESIWCSPRFEDEDTMRFFDPVFQLPVWKEITHTQRETVRLCDLIRPHMTHASWAGHTDNGYHITLESTCDSRQVRTQAVFKVLAKAPEVTVTWTNQELPTKLLNDCLHYEGDTKRVCDENSKAWMLAAEDIVETAYRYGYMDSANGLIEPSSGLSLSGSVYRDDDKNLVIQLSPPTAVRAKTEKRYWIYNETLENEIVGD